MVAPGVQQVHTLPPLMLLSVRRHRNKALDLPARRRAVRSNSRQAQPRCSRPGSHLMPISEAVLKTWMGVRSMRLMMYSSDSPPQKLGEAMRWQYLQATGF